MAKTRNPNLKWLEIDPSTLQPEVAKAYQAYKAQYAVTKERRDTFEALMHKASGLPATHTLRFGYNFGKLSIAVDQADTVSTVSKKAVSLQEALKSAA